MANKIEKAKLEDYDEVMDLANYVFGYNHGPTDFPYILPKLCKREFFMDSIHYIIREEGKIKAVVGAYPMEWEFKPQKDSPLLSLPGRGIGMVSVHPYSRSRGYMKELMNAALDDMRRDGIVFSCLNGQRQRYEYFGFNPVGRVYSFVCNTHNIRHTLGPQWSSSLSLKQVKPEDEKILDMIYSFHEAKIERIRRQRDRFFDILSSFRAKIYAIVEGDRFEGYLVVSAGRTGEQTINEINMYAPSRLPEVLGIFLNQNTKESIRINTGSHDIEKISVLFRFTENYTQGHAYHFVIFDYPRFVNPFLSIASQRKNLADGSFQFRIKDGPQFRLSVKQGLASLEKITDSGTSGSGELCLNDIEAMHFLFSPLAAEIMPVVRENTFLQSLLPLPLFLEGADAI